MPLVPVDWRQQLWGSCCGVILAHVADVRDSRTAVGRDGEDDSQGCVGVCGWVAGWPHEADGAEERGGCGVHRHGCPAITAEPVTLYTLSSGSSAHVLMIAAVEARSVEHVAVIVPEVESHMTKSCDSLVLQ